MASETPNCNNGTSSCKEGDLKGFDEREHKTKEKRVSHEHRLREKPEHRLKTIRQGRVSTV
ncbi:hypothetical protein E5676_scaffold612G00200 [Cucumis melo var. makuwa]|uniref:Uncharacterized protein n=2 Tax=Cucumis melo TaxID=3656 RepID=A0A5D3BMY6_CUCMM|nr:hypothetical protein E6C27_scaffold264G00570 [Cucumis melo var. makuwa]TYK01123.1 hypothetical protein E5676_scaffold612G00200 [Cucumis melo var. makuwa]